MSDVPTLFETLRTLITDVEGDYNKAKGGNAAAGRRVRKVMQSIRKGAKNLRDEMTQAREATKAKKAAAKKA